MPIPSFRNDGWLPVGHHQADWAEVIDRFGGEFGSPRWLLTQKLIELRNNLLSLGVTGYLLLDGSYVSEKSEPGDFDVLLIGPFDIRAVKDRDERLAMLLDPKYAEQTFGCSFFYIPGNSPALETLSKLWDLSKEGIAKGIVQVTL